MWLNTTREKKVIYSIFIFITVGWGSRVLGRPYDSNVEPREEKEIPNSWWSFQFCIHRYISLLYNLVETIERINGGDAKFNKIGDVLPELTVFTWLYVWVLFVYLLLYINISHNDFIYIFLKYNIFKFNSNINYI